MVAVADGADEGGLEGPDAMGHAVGIMGPNLIFGNFRGYTVKIPEIGQVFEYFSGIHAHRITETLFFSGGNLAADTGQSPDGAHLVEDVFHIFKRDHLAEMAFFLVAGKPGIDQEIVDERQLSFPFFGLGDGLVHRLAEVGEEVFQLFVGTDLQEEFPGIVGNIFIPFLPFAVADAEFAHGLSIFESSYK